MFTGVLSPFPPLVSPRFFFFVNFSPAPYYPNAWNRLVYQPDHYFTPLHLYVSLKLIIYIMVLNWTGSHSSVRFLGCGTTVLLPNKSSNREVQPLAALYPTARLSPCGQVRKNIHSRVYTPGPTRSVLHPGGSPLLVPLSS